MRDGEQHKRNRVGRWREKRREKKLRTADSPEKIAERRTPGDPTPGENADRAGWAGFLGPGGG